MTVVQINDEALYSVDDVFEVFAGKLSKNGIRKIMPKLGSKKICGKWYLTGLQIRQYLNKEEK